MNNEKTIAQLIQSERTRRGWSVQELSVKSGVGRSTIGQYESGYQIPSIKGLRKLMATFNLNESRWDKWMELRNKELEMRPGRMFLKEYHQSVKQITEEQPSKLEPITVTKISSINSNDVFVDTLVKKFKFHDQKIKLKRKGDKEDEYIIIQANSSHINAYRAKRVLTIEFPEANLISIIYDE